MGRHSDFLWLIAVGISPFLFGSVSPLAQSAIGFLIGLGLLAAAGQSSSPIDSGSRNLLLLLVAFLFVSILPLPAGLISAISPERARLHEEFALTDLTWFTLSTSPARSLTRIWQLVTIAGVFVLARRAAASGHRIDRAFPWVLAIALLGLGFLEVWRQWDGKGIWQNPQNYPGGPFANRNHYANWVVMGVMVCAGRFCDLLEKRRSQEAGPTQAQLGLLVLAILMGMGTVLACGSRGGVLALAIGGFVFWLLARRYLNRRAWLISGAGAAVVFCVGLLILGATVRSRFASADNALKPRIWEESLVTASQFPLTGSGPGSFERIFNLRKTFQGEGTFLHAENELVEMVVEHGVLFTVLALILVSRLLWPGVRRVCDSSRSHRWLGAGLLSALAAWLVHSQFEFVFQVFSTALLAAAIAGQISGWGLRGERPIVPTAPRASQLFWRVVAALFVAGIGALQLYAVSALPISTSANADLSALQSRLHQAVDVWPLDEKLLTAALRSAVANNQGAAVLPAFRTGIDLDPLNWRLRVELAWFYLNRRETRALGIKQATVAQTLNPLQPEIGYRFAQTLKQIDAGLAGAVLGVVAEHEAGAIRRMLELKWEVERHPAELWTAVPADPLGMKVLADFALEKGFTNLAVNALHQIPSPRDASVAARWLMLKRPAEAKAIAGELPRSREKNVIEFGIAISTGNELEAENLARSMSASRSELTRELTQLSRRYE